MKARGKARQASILATRSSPDSGAVTSPTMPARRHQRPTPKEYRENRRRQRGGGSLLGSGLHMLAVLAAGVAVLAAAFSGCWHKYHPTAATVASSYGDQFVGKLYIVTGGTSGLGFETARVLVVTSGSTVIVAGRSPARGKAATAAINDEAVAACLSSATCASAEGKAVFMELDLASLQSVANFASEVRQFVQATAGADRQIDGIVCNAGRIYRDFTTTVDG